MRSAIYYFPVLVIIALLGSQSHHRLAVFSDEIALWRDASAKSPNKARPHNNLGDALKKAYDLNGAQQHFIRALEIQPDYPDALNNLATLYASVGRSAEATDLLLKALLLNPTHIPARYNLAMQYYEQDLLSDADREYTAIIMQNPYCSEAAFAGQMLKMIHKQILTH